SPSVCAADNREALAWNLVRYNFTGAIALIRRRGRCGSFGSLLECVQRFRRLRPQRIVKRFLLSQRLQHAAIIRLDKWIKLLLESPALRNWQIVEVAVRRGIN